MVPNPFTRHSNHLIKRVMECATNAIYVIDLEGNFMLMNEAGAKICGRAIEDIVGMHFSGLFSKTDLPEVAVAFNKTAFYGEVITNHQTKVIQPSGDERDIIFSISPLKDNNKIIGVVGTAEDITERLRQERALKTYTQSLNTVLEGLDAIVYVADMETYEIIFANNRLLEFIGDRDIVGKICWQTLQRGQSGPCPFCTNHLLIDEQGNPLPESYYWEFQHTVTGRWLSIKDKAIYWYDGRLVRLEIAIDVTDAKRMQELLLEKGKKLSSIISTTTEGYWEVDSDDRIVEANDALCKMLGSSREVLVGSSIYDFVDEENAAILREQESLRAVKMHRSFNIVLKGRQGREVHARVHATTLKDQGGNVTGAFAFVTDITELLQIEGSVAMYTAALERSNRELMDFAYIASHDLQEPLRKIVAFGDRLYDHSAAILDDKGKDYLQRMQKAAIRMQQFIEDLLQYSRVMTRPQPYQPIDLKVPVQQAIMDMEECFVSEEASILMDDLPVIEADPFQMRQLLGNLISNALKFRKPETYPFIKISYRYINDDQIVINVQDNGIGFDDKYKERLFKPFSRLHGKSEYPGTGMGLAICDKIVKRHGGSIDVKSEPNKGTTFMITLPVRQGNVKS